MDSFGTLLRKYRRQCRDPLRSGALTQERLGELIGVEFNDMGYSGAAVSDWERDKSKINSADWATLLAILQVMVNCGGIQNSDEANQLLDAGNYRPLKPEEIATLFGVQVADDADAESGPPPFTAPISKRRRRQLILLEKVRRYWIEGVLDKSIAQNGQMALHGELMSEVVGDAWDGGEVPAGKRISLTAPSLQELFRGASHSLLILGDPGAGKTTTLLTLARALILQAQSDHIAPIPVVLQLSSWITEQQSLSQWVISELKTKYHIPAKIGAEWLEDDELLLLLDGYDRIPASNRQACAAAINQFRLDYGFTQIAVCARTREYLATEFKLDLGTAVQLLPVAIEQVDNYLDRESVFPPNMRQMIERSDALKELTRTPLFLTVIRSVYSQTRRSDDALASVISEESLIDAYMDHMLDPQRASHEYPQAQTLQWLSWLARRMSRHNQSEFLLAQLQPSWLSTDRWRWRYLLVTRLWDGFVIGVVLWLLLQQYRVANPNIPTAPTERLMSIFGLSPLWMEFAALVIGNLALSLLMTAISGVQFGATNGRMAHFRQDSGKKNRGKRFLWVSLTIAIPTTVLMLLIAEPFLAVAWGIVEGVVYALFAGYIHGHSFSSEVRPVDKLSWSWSNAAIGLAFGLLSAALTELFEFLIDSPNGIWQTTVTYGLVGLMLGGMRGYQIEQRSRSNEGIRLSMTNALQAALFAATVMGVLATIIWGPLSGLLMTLTVFGGTFAMFGGSNLVKHLVVRTMIWLDAGLPLGFIEFLEHATKLSILRKVGSGYIFAHDLLMERLTHRFT